jgi:mandelate racemase
MSELQTIRELRIRAMRAPMREPHRTASGIVAESPLVLTDVVTGEGLMGHSIVFTYTAAALGPTADLIRNLEPLLKGALLAPAEIHRKLARRFRLLGTQGLVGMALAAIDMALWDALARSHGVSLARLLGGVESRCGRMARWDTTASAVRRRWRKTGFGAASRASRRRSGIPMSKRISK